MPATLDDLFNVLTNIVTLLKKEYEGAGVDWNIEVLSINDEPGSLYAAQKPVRRAVLQNLSTTDPITIGRGQSGKPASLTAGEGIVLNPASQAGYGGGSTVLHNIDLSQVTAVTVTGDSQPLAVAYYY